MSNTRKGGAPVITLLMLAALGAVFYLIVTVGRGPAEETARPVAAAAEFAIPVPAEPVALKVQEAVLTDGEGPTSVQLYEQDRARMAREAEQNAYVRGLQAEIDAMANGTQEKVLLYQPPQAQEPFIWALNGVIPSSPPPKPAVPPTVAKNTTGGCDELVQSHVLEDAVGNAFTPDPLAVPKPPLQQLGGSSWLLPDEQGEPRVVRDTHLRSTLAVCVYSDRNVSVYVPTSVFTARMVAFGTGRQAPHETFLGRIYLPRSKACEMSFREILLDKVSGFGYIMVDESIWRPAGA